MERSTELLIVVRQLVMKANAECVSNITWLHVDCLNPPAINARYLSQRSADVLVLCWAFGANLNVEPVDDGGSPELLQG
ncbi:hypothetical protein ACRWF1_17670 [Escherichia coli]